MNASTHFFARETDDYALNLTPMTEADNVPSVAAPLGADGCLQPRIIAELLDELGCIRKRRSARDEG